MEIALKKGSLMARAETLGGELVSLKDGSGTEYIWVGDPAYWAGRNPLLFPIVSRLKDGKVRFGGVEYAMNQHGFARRKEFSVVEQGEDFVVLELREDASTLEVYPYPFCLQVRQQLLEDGFYTEFVVENTGGGAMPFCLGAHTGFNCPLREGEKFEDYSLVFEQPEQANSTLSNETGLLTKRSFPVLDNTDTIPLDYKVYDEVDTLVFENLKSKTVQLRHNTGGHGVEMDFSQFPMLGFWTKPNACAPYICIEPWQGCAAYEDESGDFEDKPHCVVLQPGEKKTLRYTVRIL